MKKFTRILSLVLAVLMLATVFTACGGKKETSSKRTHDQNTYILSNKDERAAHNFVDGKCTLCDETTAFVQNPVGGTPVLTEECDQKGTIEEFWYDTRAYYVEQAYKDQNVGELPVRKRAFVYLPYGYDANDKETKYNVLYLLHGSGLNEGYWFKQGTYADNDGVYTKGFGTMDMLDKLFKSGEIEKTIIVTPTLYARDSSRADYGESNAGSPSDYPEYPVINDSVDSLQCFGYELKNELMPYVAEHYNTYAASGSPEDLIAARDHQAYAGLSLGSMTSFGSIFSYCLDYISYVGSYSGGPMFTDVDTMINTINTEYKDYPVNYWYFSCGSSEYDVSTLDFFVKFRDALNLQDGSDVANGDSCAFMLVNGTAHNYATWITCLYNSLHVFFKAK